MEYDIPRDLSSTDDFRHLGRSGNFEMIAQAVIRSYTLVIPVLSRVHFSHINAFETELKDVEMATQCKPNCSTHFWIRPTCLQVPCLNLGVS